MSYEGSTFYRQVGGAQSKWFTAGAAGVCVCVHVCVGWCIVVVAAALAGIASSLHSSRRSGGKNGWKLIVLVAFDASWVLFAASDESVLWMGVFSQGEVCAVQRKYSIGRGISGKQSRVKWT